MNYEEEFGKIVRQYLDYISTVDGMLMELMVREQKARDAIMNIYLMGNEYLADKGWMNDFTSIDNMVNLKQIAMVEMLDYCMMCSFLDGRLSGSRVRMINATFNTHMDSIEMSEYLQESWESFWSECPLIFEVLLMFDGKGLSKGIDKTFWELYCDFLLSAYSCIDAAGENDGTEQNIDRSAIRDYVAMLIRRVKEFGLPIPMNLAPFLD